MRLALLSAITFLCFASSAASQETLDLELEGRVHTVFTEDFVSDNGNVDSKQSSTYSIFDERGYRIESFLYKPDGSLWCHSITTRDGDHILKEQVFGFDTFVTYTVENHYDAQGRAIETDEFDGDGFLKKKTVSSFTDDKATHTIVTRWTETGPDGMQKSGEITDVTDVKTNVTRQVSSVNGSPVSDWQIERTADGKGDKDKIVMPDGSYVRRETHADGSQFEDRYHASTNSHQYQTTDSQGRVIEVKNGSGANAVRSTYRFDEKGRPAGQTNYNDSGQIIDKCDSDYIEDSFGNWIEKRSRCQHTEPDSSRDVVATTRRIISYYGPARN